MAVCGIGKLSKAIKHHSFPDFYGKSLPDLGFRGNPGAQPFPSFCRNYNLRHSWQKLFPCHDLSSQYCFCSSLSHHVAPVCLQPEIRLIEELFTMLHLDKLAKIQWLSNDHKFMALLIAYYFGMVGYHMLIFDSGIERISGDYFEAATLDGANKLQQFRHITLPLLKGMFHTNITMWSVSSVGFFVWSQLFSTVTADTQTITPMVYMYMQIFGAGNSVTERNAGIGAAVGVCLSLCVVLIFQLCNRLFRDKDLEF